jgi:hypothetical protein
MEREYQSGDRQGGDDLRLDALQPERRTECSREWRDEMSGDET